MKKYVISIGCFLGVLLLLFVTMAIVPMKETIPVGKPTTIRVYNQSLTPKTYQEGSQKENYDAIFSYVTNMTKVSILQRLMATNTAVAGWTQPTDGKEYVYSNQLQSKGVCVELLFDKAQSFIVNIGGSTKKIETKALLFEVKPSKNAYVANIYFGINNSSTSPQYVSSDGNSYPLQTVVRTYSLYKYILDITKK